MADARPRPPGKPRGSAASSVKAKRRSTRASVTPSLTPPAPSVTPPAPSVTPPAPSVTPPAPSPAVLPEDVLDTPLGVTEETNSEEEVNNGLAVREEDFQDPHISQREMFRKRVALLGVTEESWTEDNMRRLDEYAADTSVTLMVVYLDPSAGLQVDFAMPSQVVDQVAYFIRQPEAEILEETFEVSMRFGTVHGEPTEGLLRLMSTMFVPNMAQEAGQWPESVRNHSIVDLHHYLSKLTDARFKLEGKTVLYIPMEALQQSPEEASKDKALVGRLEIVVIHWTRQIKEMLKAQEAVEMGEISGPLEEIVFWRNRLEDLLGISKQLQKPQIARIQRTLELVRSHYVQPFCTQAEAIQASSRQAGFNLHWLSLLKEPCEKLAGLHPSQMAPTLKYIISLIRIIWVNSPCYNTKERMSALLLKMGNEIIRLCCQSISLDRIFQGYVTSSRQALNDCIQCCLGWKELYQHAAQIHRKLSPKDWVLDETSLFPLIDIFVQRCKDLLEVCDCQQQFARREEGPQMAPLPCFGGGHQKEELTRSLLAIEGTFDRCLQVLRSVGKGILDIRNSSWFHDYKRFCHAVKDLEVRLQNLLRSALETVDSVEEGVMLIDIFRALCARPAMRGTLDRMTVTVWDIFHKELDLVNKELSERSGAAAAHMPHHAGQAHWARGLRQRIERPMEVIREAHFLPRTVREDEVRLAHGQLAQALDELVRRSYQQWKEGLDGQSHSRLERPLIARCRDDRSMLDVNFDRNLLKMFCEIYYWERLQFEIPHYVSAIYQRSQDLQDLRASVLLLVSHYNRIMEALSPAELDLFRERIAFLDKKFQPGLTKLLWNTKGVADFISDCRLHTSKVQSIVDRYKAANLAISSHCRQISETLLVRVDGKTVYRAVEFEEEQKVYRQRQLQRLRSAHQDIVKLMNQVYGPFRTDGPEVQQHWVTYTERMDRLVEEALRLSVKRSMQELCRAVTGDKKAAPKPIFRVEVVLRPKADGTSAKVQFSPTLQKLAQLVNGVGAQLVGAVSVFKRLPDVLAHKPSQRKPVHAVIEEDEEIVKIQAAVSAGTASNAVHLQTYLQTWDGKYREIWEINKDGFVRRYQKLNQPVSSFDADIARYTEVANNVQKEEAVVSVQFVLLDCTPLKMSLVQHCDEWQGKFTQLLSLTACTRLRELHGYLHDNSSRLRAPTQTQAELVESLQLLETLQGDVSRLEGQIAPIHEQFAILDKYEVPVELPVQQMLETLNGEWSWFRKTLLDSGTVLRQRREEVKRELLTSTKEFTMKTQRALHEFNSSGPFGSAVRSIFARMEMEAVRGQLDGLKEEDGRLRHGLAMFAIEPPPSKDIHALEKDLGHLQEVWELVQLWNNKWDKWKKVAFSRLHTDSMEAEAHSMLTKLHTLSTQLKDKQWEIVDFTRNKIEQFKMTIPVITDLRNPAMRDRHWQQVGQELQSPFEQTLTLESLMALGLDQHTDTMQEISTSASKELNIEQDLEGISKTWEEVSLDITPYRDQGHHMLRGTEEVLQTLEDNQVVLSGMKASRFVRPFVGEVDRWERRLSQVHEVIEMILTAQRLWMYLENIFLGGDMRKQLREECEQFDVVSSSWKAIMESLRTDHNALQGTQHPGLPEKLGRMITELEEIQKSLESYLDTRRQLFPRFYFLSDDDLVEILGQSRNPAAVQPHLNNCFTGIHSLRVCKVGSSGIQSEASGMLSVDKEFMDFSHPVLLDGPVESWLCDVEKAMRTSLNDCLRSCRLALRKMTDNREKWVRDWPGQMLITASQIQWTADITKCLIMGKERGNRSELKAMMKKQMSMLGLYSEVLRGNLSQTQRVKMVALVTVEVHGRDVIDSLGRVGCKDVNSFDWLSQLRFYWEKEVDDCVIRQTSACFKYGYEYLGNSGRLVITPLTDRCFMALTTALHLHRGSSLKGPAGTGKTETVKDLGKALGMHVIVVNCSEGLDYKCMARMFSGLAQIGAWGCFDEFNRVSVGVQSVLAQRIHSILVALATGQDRFVYEWCQIRLVPSCGIFITMNPGYNGHTELPDNLKCMFRPFSMVVPDSAVITHITLFGEGFGKCEELSQKVCSVYRLVVELLSKQDHYDFGLRALLSLLHYAGNKRRCCPNMTDEEILVMSLKDMNLAKLTSDDLLLFNEIIQDLFPAVEAPTIDYSKLREAIENELRQSGLQVTPFTVTKGIQLYKTKKSHHACMLVGKTGSGKSVTWRALQGALTALHRKGEADFQLVREYPLNPKALSVGELYGETDPSTNKWRDGVLSSIMRTACTDEKADEKWLVLDGPVDALWIESMNSLMDDNKVLTLINGERISMPPQVSLLFEVEDLAMASPATVSRCGVVYHDCSDLGWKPYVQSWLDRRHQAEVEHLRRLFDRYAESTLSFKKSSCKEPVPVTELSAVSSLCRLYHALATPENGVNPSETEHYARMVELWFTFSLIWSACASVDESGREKMDNFLREMEGSFPNKHTIYDYYVDTKNKTWAPFQDKLPKGWRYAANAPFYKIVVPTVDTVRYSFLVRSLVMAQYPVLLTGPVGTGKTLVAQGVLQGLDTSHWTVHTVNMSSQTTSNNVQAIIERRVEKRTKGEYVPLGGKRMLCFLDDLNMPSRDPSGSQPPLELLRLWMDYGFWYDRRKQTTKAIKDMFLLASMAPPGGGRNHISGRLQGRFSLINMTFPNDAQILHIYGSMVKQRLEVFEEELKPLGQVVTQATVELYHAVTDRFLPTPNNTHYLFNLRDISKVFQGLLRVHRDFHDTKHNITRLWTHECFRVFSDRLVDHRDMEAFGGLLAEKLGSHFDLAYHNICPNKMPPLFGDFRKEVGVYEDLTDMSSLRSYMESQLEEYNLQPAVVPMSLVLFRDAIQHITRVVRVISQPRGNMLLVGIGGSGRQSAAKMAAFLCQYQVFQVEINRHYRKQDFREDIKRLYRLTGVDNKPTVFLLNDSHISEESFLEDVNNILSSGEVPNLYKQAEYDEVCNALSESARKDKVMETPDSLFSYLMERVRNNLHVVLCMSPVGHLFRTRIRQYPALVHCTTMDWFCEWPRDALLEVAQRYLHDQALGTTEGIQTKVSSVCVTVHQSVAHSTRRMTLELRRHNYVTPTNYLELVSGYNKLLSEKHSELGEQVNKLRTGLLKIDDTRSKVEAMSLQLTTAKKNMADFQRQCDEYLDVIVTQKKEADEQQKVVSAHSEKISAEEVKCKTMAENAQRDLEVALPALEEAMKALESLNKKDLTEIKSYGRPPAPVETVMMAVMTLLGKEPTWTEAKRQLGEGNFINTLVHFDKDNISDLVLRKIAQYCYQSDFQPDIIGRVSLAAKSLCMWVRAMEVYGRVYRVVEPKRALLRGATAQLAEKQAALAQAQHKLTEVGEKLEQLKGQYSEKSSMKEKLKAESMDMELKLDRAAKLVSGLAEEGVRWEDAAAALEESMGYLVGDCLLAASFLSYLGPFPSSYRDQLMDVWMKEVRDLEVPCSPQFSFSSFLSDAAGVRQWNAQGLLSDAFSTENAVIVTRCNRWPLMVDPQGQALKWIRNMEVERGLKVIDLQMSDYLGVLEKAMHLGTPVLLQNVQEELDPCLTPILHKSLTRIGGRQMLRLGDRDVEYNPQFRLYITTKLLNPHYTPHVSTKTTIVNFAVKEQGLEDQLLGVVLRMEVPDLEEQKDALVVSMAAGKKKLQDMEDEILRLLNEASGSLLEEETLVDTLHSSKVTAREVAKQLESSLHTEAKIDTAREAYRPCAQRASILFLVLMDLGSISPMYQFSLDAYMELFSLSIKQCPRHHKLEDRILSLNNYHTFSVYTRTCWGLLKDHTLLFSFHMCVRILEGAGRVNADEYGFFLRGGLVLDKAGQMDNPCPGWLPDSSWDNVTELDKLANFHGVMASFELHPNSWRQWYTSAEPDNTRLPGEWEERCDDLQKMLVVRSLRLDRVSSCVTSFITKNLDASYRQPPALHMQAVLEASSSRTPLVFVLSPGADPAASLTELAEACGASQRFHALSMGQGQAAYAKAMVLEGAENGHWVFLANCHLSLSWMPELDQLLEQLHMQDIHPDFRLWLSSSPHPDFPISILQASIKITTEPPQGVKANVSRVYELAATPEFRRCSRPAPYRKLLFALCFFHSVLLERRKFLQLGWNHAYAFSDADFEASESLLRLCLDESEEVPWDTLRSLIAAVSYGGHVTDEWDRRLLTAYSHDCFCEAAVTQPHHRLTSLPEYFLPADGTPADYKDYVGQLPPTEHPEVFGLHPNADVANQVAVTRTLFATLLSLQPQDSSTATGTGPSREDKVLELCAELRSQLPALMDHAHTRSLLQEQTSPLTTVLLQEIHTYNALLTTVKSSLVELEEGIRGLVVMSPNLEEIFNCIYDGRVPTLWAKAYASVKPLAWWIRDLCQRVEQFARWAETARPPVLYWLSGFTSPTGFLTAVLQASARHHHVPVETLTWDFTVFTVDDSNLLFPPKDGVYMRGLYLEGAGWDQRNSCLVEAEAMQLVCPVPTIHFKPTVARKKTTKGTYSCPCYSYPVRSGGAGGPSFVVAVDLQTGAAPPEHWVKRGTALLLGL